MSGQKIIDGLNDVLAGNISRETTIMVDRSPESIIADVIAQAQGHPTTTGAARRMAHKATRALRDAGWRILR